MVEIKSSENALNSKLHREGEAEKSEEDKSGKDREKVHRCDGRPSENSPVSLWCTMYPRAT